ncbi:MAG: conjugal transfer protein TraX, partial [Clostridiales bacterium]|nr:conjugal transfer protein TraX [Clostridiales bacterium]
MTGFQIKLLAFIFMIFDHSAYMFPDVLPPWFRFVGRFSFPAFAFFIAEGCRKTRSIEKYMLRLGIFAAVSEIPHDLCFKGAVNYLVDMNIGWTLLAGALLIYIYKMKTGPVLKGLCSLCFLGGLSFLDLDYGLWGVLLIFAYYIFEGKAAVIFSTVIIFTLKWAGYIYPLNF